MLIVENLKKAFVKYAALCFPVCMLNYPQLIISVALFFLLAACGEKPKLVIDNVRSFSDFPVNDSVSFDVLFEYKDGEPYDLHLIDSTLVIRNPAKAGIEYFLYKYSLKNNQLSRGILKMGRGPGEALGVSVSGISGDALWLYDLTLGKVLTIDKEILLAHDSVLKEFDEYKIQDHYYRLDFIDSLHFAGVGNMLSKSKVNVVNLISGQQVNELGEVNTIPPDVIPNEALKDAYITYVYTNSANNKIALPYRYTDILEIMSLEDGKSFAVKGPTGFDSDMELSNVGGRNLMLKTENTKKAFVKGAVTNQYIYLIYSGNLRVDENWSYGNQIFVYDWDGNPVRRLFLDKYIFAIAVSEDDTMIYSYDVNSGYIVQAQIN